MVRPRYAERFSFRALLLYVECTKNFAKIRRISGEHCCSFREARKARGLSADMAEWLRALAHAFRSSSGHSGICLPQFLRNDSDALPYVLLEVKNNLLNIVTAPFSNVKLPALRDDIASLAPELLQDLNLEALYSELIV